MAKLKTKNGVVKDQRPPKANPTKYGELEKCIYCKNLVGNMAKHISEKHQSDTHYNGNKAMTAKNIIKDSKICD